MPTRHSPSRPHRASAANRPHRASSKNRPYQTSGHSAWVKHQTQKREDYNSRLSASAADRAFRQASNNSWRASKAQSSWQTQSSIRSTSAAAKWRKWQPDYYEQDDGPIYHTHDTGNDIIGGFITALIVGTIFIIWILSIIVPPVITVFTVLVTALSHTALPFLTLSTPVLYLAALLHYPRATFLTTILVLFLPPTIHLFLN